MRRGSALVAGAAAVVLALVLTIVSPAAVSASAAAAAAAREVSTDTEPGVPYWGDERTDVDDGDALDPNAELVLLDAGARADAEADADEEDAAADESEFEAEAEADADAEDAALEEAEADADADADADTDTDADADEEEGVAIGVDAELSAHSPVAMTLAAAEEARTASGMADRAPDRALAGSSLVEHDARFRHNVPLQANTWAAMLIESRGYQSNAMRAAHKSQVKGGPCAGVIGAHCKHTADMQSSIGPHDKWQDECAKLICNPLCLRYTWDVKIIAEGGPEGFEDAVNSLGTQYSLGAQFRAHACGKEAGCCEENEDLLNWVELRNFAGMFPESPQPALACDLRANAVNGEQTPTKDELCAQCKEAITVEAEAKEDVCEYFVKVPDPPDMGDEDEVFARNGESAAAQIPKHKSFKEKCEAVQGLMAGIISGLASGEWKEKACSCLGCCEASPGEECYYPVVYGTNDEAHAAHKS